MIIKMNITKLLLTVIIKTIYNKQLLFLNFNFYYIKLKLILKVMSIKYKLSAAIRGVKS